MENFKLTLVVGAFSVLTACTPTKEAVKCNPTDIGYQESRLGLSYRDIASSPVSEILSQGEVEYLSNINKSVQLGVMSQEDVAPLWKGLINGALSGSLPRFTGNAREPQAEILRLDTPNMVKRLRACVSPSDPRFGHLAELPIAPLPEPGPNDWEG